MKKVVAHVTCKTPKGKRTFSIDFRVSNDSDFFSEKFAFNLYGISLMACELRDAEYVGTDRFDVYEKGKKPLHYVSVNNCLCRAVDNFLDRWIFHHE